MFNFPIFRPNSGQNSLEMIKVDLDFSVDRSSITSSTSEHSPTSQTMNPSVAYALLCGVEDYPGSENDLNYCEEDVSDMASFLQSEFNIPNSQITQLYNSEASELGIIEAIQSYQSILDENDYFFFYYSGHGTSDIDTNSISYTVNSPHPYYNNFDNTWYVGFPGVNAIRVHFTRIDTETNFDGIYVGDAYNYEYAYDLFSGHYTDAWSSWVFSDKLYIELISDYDTTEWGFSIDKIETMVFQAPYGLYPYSSMDDTLLTGEELKAEMDKLSGVQICFLDSCHSGGVGSALAAPNREVFCACGANEFSVENPEINNGVFTYNFINSWSDSADLDQDGQISFQEAFSRCRSATISQSTDMGSVHHPYHYDGGNGEIHLNPYIDIEDGISVIDNSIVCSGTNAGLGFSSLYLSFIDTNSPKDLLEIEIDCDFPIGAFENYIINLDHSIDLTKYDLVAYNFLRTYGDEEYADFEYKILNPSLTEPDFGLYIDETFEDFDGDGIPDLLEILAGYSPTCIDSDSNLIADGKEDYDQDGLTNVFEISIGTNILNDDSDFDGYSDFVENEKGTNPLKKLRNPLSRGIIVFLIVGGICVIGIVAYKKNSSNFDFNHQRDLQKPISSSPLLRPVINRSRITETYYLFTIYFWDWKKKFSSTEVHSFSQKEFQSKIFEMINDKYGKDVALITKYGSLLSIKWIRYFWNEIYVQGKSRENYLREGITNPNSYIFSRIMEEKPKDLVQNYFLPEPTHENYKLITKKMSKLWKFSNFKALFEFIYSDALNISPNFKIRCLFNWIGKTQVQNSVLTSIFPEWTESVTIAEFLIGFLSDEDSLISSNYLETSQKYLIKRSDMIPSASLEQVETLLFQKISLDPLMLNDWLDLASLYLDYNEIEKAKGCYLIALFIDPYSHFIWSGLEKLSVDNTPYLPPWLLGGVPPQRLLQDVKRNLFILSTRTSLSNSQRNWVQILEFLTVNILKSFPIYVPTIDQITLKKNIPFYSVMVMQNLLEWFQKGWMEGRNPPIQTNLDKSNETQRHIGSIPEQNSMSFTNYDFKIPGIPNSVIIEQYQSLKERGYRAYEIKSFLPNWIYEEAQKRDIDILYPEIYQKVQELINLSNK